MTEPVLADLEWTDPACPVARTLDLVGDRWSLLIVRDAMDGARAFRDFQQATGIARNILTDRLRRLVARGILERAPGPSGRRHVYTLTPAGRDLFTVVVALRQWGERHAFGPAEQHSVLVGDDGSPIPELRPTSSTGGPVDSESTSVRKVG
ncbi:helix-turn-helix transcriptional regulator [Nocardia elegans]|uniref:Winged helix-turn-helix transcriptional regulator n=1 Tax=Nocardia elegans TaxID=300029 RepID=A0ABW6TFF7_9NOCA|nr:helix-turn-helix domain-containing protein [Nocardia elegans]MBF6448043.1 helix-turn-helix transcriptional regulator [Nocardia elegans]